MSSNNNNHNNKSNSAAPRRGAGVPIPSFGVADISPEVSPTNVPPGRSNNNNNNRSSNNDATTTKKSSMVITPAEQESTAANDESIPARWNVSQLVQLEISLQRFFRQHSQMTFEEFWALVRKMDWSVESKKINRENSPHDELLRELTLEERLWHDLVCVAANASSNSPLYKVNLQTRTLELVPHTMNSFKLCLGSTSALPKSWSKQIREAIAEHRMAKHKASVDAAKAKLDAKQQQQQKQQQQRAPQALIQPGMTIDERVLARANAKLQHEAHQREQDQKDPRRAQQTKDGVDHMWLVQLADALWSHARHVLRRQEQALPSKLASNSLLMPNSSKRQRTDPGGGEQQQVVEKKPPSKSRPCVMTFGDIVDTVAKSGYGQQSTAQVAQALFEMEKYQPKWVSIPTLDQSNDYGNNKNNKKSKNNKPKDDKKATKLPRNATVFLQPDNYQEVRRQITGVDVKLSERIDTSYKQPPAAINTTSTRTTVEASGPRKRPSPVSTSKNLLADFEKDKKMKTQHSNNNNYTASVTPAAAAPTTAPGLTTPPASKKRERDVGLAAAAVAALPSSPSRSPSHSSGSPKRKKRLRINPNFILSDADYNGGEVLPASVLETVSPRGLKRLFMQLNSGERI